MLRKFIYYLFSCIEKVTGKLILYYTPSVHNALGMTATRASGFWYVGNVYDTADIAYGIAQQGVVEPEETALVSRIFTAMGTQKEFVVYDVGANTGYYSLLAACNYNAQVVAFEPVPAHSACIAESVRLNNVTERVQIFTCALSDETTKKELYLFRTGSSFDPTFIGTDTIPHTTVQVEKLDTLIVNEKLPAPDFIKIDVEGHERKVLAGAQKLLEKIKPILFVEITNSIAARGFINTEYAQTFALLAQYGYIAYRLEGATLAPHDATHTPAPDGVCMYLFLNPNVHEHLVATAGI